MLRRCSAGCCRELNWQSLYVAVGILGATVMPHNLYLHSALVQTRQIGDTQQDKRRACFFNFIDSAIALNGALFVNAAILVMAAAVFFRRHIVVTEIQQAHQLLSPMLGTTAAGVLFGAALLCSGQSSTLTGTMAGQIVMEGFLRFRMQPWLRRAYHPLFRHHARRPHHLLFWRRRHVQTHHPEPGHHLLSIATRGHSAGAFHQRSQAHGQLRQRTLAADRRLDIRSSHSCSQYLVAVGSGERLGFGRWPLSSVRLGCGYPGFSWLCDSARDRHHMAMAPRVHESPPSQSLLSFRNSSAPVYPARIYSRILVPLDHSDADHEALGNALALAKMHRARIILLHVEEGVTSQYVWFAIVYCRDYRRPGLSRAHCVLVCGEQNVGVDVVVRHGNSPAQEIASAVQDLQPDLVIMASHGHRGIKDLIFGTTINNVRHRVKVPLLIVSRS